LPPNVHKKLADALGQIGKLEAAIEAYQQAIELNSNNASFKAVLEDAMEKLNKN